MIRELPLEVRSKIAAGEVIERPVSVVKELVENALDAGATDIKVSVINGGLDEIMVSDNGCGMPFEELPLAVKRFTTSKIGSVEDLDSIATLGFRGEALASIADVADLTIFSCDGETSGQLRIRGGELLLCKPVASPKGTRVIVRDLFFNLPAHLPIFARRSISISAKPNIITATDKTGINITAATTTTPTHGFILCLDTFDNMYQTVAIP